MDTVFTNLKQYKDIAEKKSYNYVHLEKAFDIVQKFIIDNKRILYGGTAIDLSLKLLNHEGIYQDDAIPDYDFMSPTFYEDSNNLAILLYKAGLPNVSAINAAHFNSRRVRVNFVTVADISYVPENIYVNVPTIKINSNSKNIKKYKGLTIVHPDFQRMDLHRAFNIPFSNPPQEVILHRLEKDQKRFKLINNMYSLGSIPNLKNIKNQDKNHDKNQIKLTINKEYYYNAVIGGILNYGLIFMFLKSLLSEKSIIAKIVNATGINDFIQEKMQQIIPVNINITKDEFELLLDSEFNKTQNNVQNQKFTIITDFYSNLISKIKKNIKIEPKYYNKFLDNLRPRTILFNNVNTSVNKYDIEIFDNNGELLPCYNLQKTINVIKKLIDDKNILNYEENNENISLAHTNHTLLYFLNKYFETKQEYFKHMYISLLNIIEVAEKIVLSIEDQNPELLQKIYKHLPFFLTSNTYGEHNWSVDYVVNIKDKKYFLQNVPATDRVVLRPPFGFYPEKEVDPIEFNVQDSELYKIDGLQVDKEFLPISLDI